MQMGQTGTEEYTEGLVWGLNRIGVSVVGMGRPGSAILPDQPGLGLPPRKGRPWWAKWWWENFGVTGIPKEADLLQIPYMAHPPRTLKTPIVVTVHDLIPFRLDAYRQRFKERAYFTMVRQRLPYATALVAISEATRRDIQDFFPALAHKVTVIPNGVHPAFFQAVTEEQLQVAKEHFQLVRRPRILYVGGYDERKNVSTLVAAAREVFARRHDGELVLVGAKAHLEVHRVIEELGMRAHTVLTPRISRELLVALYHAADIFAFPSTFEGFGLGPAQALAAGVPIVAGDTPAVREVVGAEGILVRPKVVDDWIDALQQTIASPALTQSMMTRGRMRAEDFRWEKVAKAYQDLYARVVDHRGKTDRP